ncbi:MAG: hypothetical protein U0T81_01210 [Saprospiraceae bacterium]
MTVHERVCGGDEHRTNGAGSPEHQVQAACYTRDNNDKTPTTTVTTPAHIH